MNAHIITNRTVSAGTLTRTAALGLALTNQLLSAAGKPLLPIDNAQLEQMICTGFTVGAALAAWWIIKLNYLHTVLLHMLLIQIWELMHYLAF